jgi:hypothetical protein
MNSMRTYDSNRVFDLQQSVKELFTDPLLEQLASCSGEDLQSIKKGLQISNAAASVHIFLHTRQPKKQLGIQRMARVAAGSSLHKELLHLYQGKPRLQGILNMTRIVFGDAYRAIEKQISKEAQLKETTVHGLMQLSVPALLSICGSKIASRKLSPEGFALFMEQLQPDFALLLPAGVTFPVPQWEKESRSVAVSGRSRRTTVKNNPVPVTGPWKWSFFILAGLAVITLILLV